MKIRLLFVAAAVVFTTVAWGTSTAVGQNSEPKSTLHIAVVSADPSNDLCRTMTANFDGVKLCRSLDEAVALKRRLKKALGFYVTRCPSASKREKEKRRQCSAQ